MDEDGDILDKSVALGLLMKLPLLLELGVDVDLGLHGADGVQEEADGDQSEQYLDRRHPLRGHAHWSVVAETERRDCHDAVIEPTA